MKREWVKGPRTWCVFAAIGLQRGQQALCISIARSWRNLIASLGGGDEQVSKVFLLSDRILA